MSKIDVFEKYKHLINTKINKWTVLNIYTDKRHPEALCECECGTIKKVGLYNLIKGMSKDCGCGRKKTLSELKSSNLVGQKFGKLTVIEKLKESSKFKRRLYRCKCDCGNEVIVQSNSLTSNHTSSCGCLNSYYNMYIEQYLKKINIDYIKEYRICIDDVQYRFDFLLPKYNLMIEYDGIQHFEPVRFHSNNKEKNEETFKKNCETR